MIFTVITTSWLCVCVCVCVYVCMRAWVCVVYVRARVRVCAHLLLPVRVGHAQEYDAAFYWIDSMLEHNDYQYTPQAVTNR